MSTPENPPAFPPHPYSTQHGLTMRDYFAAKAMQSQILLAKGDAPGLVAAMKKAKVEYAEELFARNAYQMADAMLAARNRAGEEGRS